MNKETFTKNFDIALQQYFTIDRNKCERFGNLIQGFIGVKKGDNAHIIPFMITDLREFLDKKGECFFDLYKETIESSDYLGVSFVQHYIHYTYGTYS